MSTVDEYDASWTDSPWYELSAYDRDRLGAASVGLGDFGVETPGMRRYVFYRKHGYSMTDSLAYALCWLRNAIEQYERRLSHETGAEGWRAI